MDDGDESNKRMEHDVAAAKGSPQTSSTPSTGSPLTRFHTSVLNSIEKQTLRTLQQQQPRNRGALLTSSRRSLDSSLRVAETTMESSGNSASKAGDVLRTNTNRPTTTNRKRSFGSISNSTGEQLHQTHGLVEATSSFLASSPLSAATTALSSTASRLFSNQGNQRHSRRKSSLFGNLNSSRSALDFGNKKTSGKSLFTFGRQTQRDAVAQAADSAKETAASIGQNKNAASDHMSSPSRRSINNDWASRDVPPFSPPSSSSSKPSLFGAVMQKFGPNSLVEGSKGTGHYRTEDMSNLSTPTKSKAAPGNYSIYESQDSRSSTKTARAPTSSHGTPTSSRSGARSGTTSSTTGAAWSMLSPHGNSIMNIVKGMVMNSPFRFQSPEKKRRRKKTSISSTPSSSTPQRSIKRRRLNLDLDENSRDASNLAKRLESTSTLSTTSPALLLSPSASSRTPNRPRRRGMDIDEWHEALLIQPSGTHDNYDAKKEVFCGMSLVDWSLKERVRMECHPATIATAVMNSRQWDSAMAYWQHPATPLPPSILLLLEQQHPGNLQNQIRTSSATDMFAPKSQNVNAVPQKLQRTQSMSSVSSRHGVARKGTTGNGNLVDKAKATGTKVVDSIQPVAQTSNPANSKSKRNQALAARLVRSVKGPHATLGRQGHESKSQVTPGSDLAMANSFLVQRRRDWQEAFRSVYLKWQSQWSELEASSSRSESQPNSWMDCYFYCVSPDHTVLFRLRNPQHALTSTTEDGGTAMIPQVLISNTTPAVKEKLIQKGIERVEYLAPDVAKLIGIDTQDTLFSPQEKATPQPRAAPGGTFLSPMSPTLVQAELEALRKAQVHGETAGADVSVKIKKSNNENSNSNKGPDICDNCTGPLLLSGLDDVALFFEVYFNTHGRLSTLLDQESLHNANATKKIQAQQRSQDVPLILCRSVGPFANATRKLLHAFPCESPTERKENDGNGINRNSSAYAAFEFESDSAILPCSIRSMVATMSAELIAHNDDTSLKHSGVTAPQGPFDDNNRQSESVGTHHMILHLSTERPTYLSNELSAFKPTKSISSSVSPSWTKTSAWLNHGEDPAGTVLPSAGLNVDECQSGRVVPLLVWDVTRKDAVAYKLENSGQPAPSNLGLLDLR